MSLTINFAELDTNEDWIGALAKIVIHAASQIEATEADRDNLETVLDKFQDKLPDRAALEPLLEIASAMSTVVMINIINDAINKINKNNRELKLLTEKLGVQVGKINNSAALLSKITAQINKATEVVKTAKQIAEAAGSPDLSKIEKLKAILESLENLKEIFNDNA